MVLLGNLGSLTKGLLLLTVFCTSHVLASSTASPSVVQPSHTPSPVPQRQFKSITINSKDGPKNRLMAEPEGNQLVYYVDRGFAIAFGDINLGPEKDLLEKVKAKSKRSSSRYDLSIAKSKRSHSIFPGWDYAKWPSATFIWKFYDKDAENELQFKMTEATKRWKAAAPYFRFQQLPTSSDFAPGIVTVVVTRNQPACWAPIGWCQSCGLTISLDVACNIANTVHEIGHALGLHHEHQRPDRDNYVFFNCSALADYSTYGTAASTCAGNPQKCCQSATCYGWACSFAKLTSYDSHGPYDTKSVMHYREDAFSSYIGFPWPKTLVGINGNTVPPFDYDTPSEGDKTRLCEIYNVECKRGPVDDPVCGNGVKEFGEECDDGNLVNGDGCSSQCKIESVCATCDPNPLHNKCDISTSCLTTHPSGETYCACRAGYKADSGSVGQGKGPVQWRLNFVGQEYRVFVKPGVACNTLCDEWDKGPANMCKEVAVQDTCDRK